MAKSRTKTYTATFAGGSARFVLTTDPDDDRPAAKIELVGTTTVPDAPGDLGTEHATKVKIERGRKDRARFSVHRVAGELRGYLTLGGDDFEFLARALAARPAAQATITGAIEFDPGEDGDDARFEVDYFELAIA